MEITIDTLISLATLLVGGGGGAFFTWRWQRKRAKAEAESAEISATKEMQDMYQQMLEDAKRDREDRRAQVEELRAERDHYKSDRNELRDRMGKMEDTMLTMKMDIARNGRKLEAMRPFMCGVLNCKHRQRVTISNDEDNNTTEI